MTENAKAPPLDTPEGAQRWLDQLKETIVEQFHSSADGSLMPQSIMVITRDPSSSEKLEKPGLMVVGIAAALVNDNHTSAKDRLALYLQRTARRTDAIGYAFCSEAWVLSEKQRPKQRMNYGDVPGRREVLLLMGEHKMLSPPRFFISAPIIRPKSGKASVGEWQQADDGSGRFADVLMNKEDSEFSESTFDKLILAARFMTPLERRRRLEHVINESRSRGMPETVAKEALRYMLARLREAGVPGADEDVVVPAPKVDTMEIVNLAEAVPPPPGEPPEAHEAALAEGEAFTMAVQICRGRSPEQMRDMLAAFREHLVRNRGKSADEADTSIAAYKLRLRAAGIAIADPPRAEPQA